MTSQTLKPIHLNLLCDLIRDGKCVPFIGAGANVSSSRHGYEGLALGAGLAKALLDQVKLEPAEQRHVEKLDLVELAQALEVITDRPYLMKLIRTILNDEHVLPSPLLKALAKMPFRLIVSTNYDRLLERAHDEIQKPYKVVVPPVDETEHEKLHQELASFNGLRIFKMHGTFIDSMNTESHRSIIVTEDDYIDFLGKLAQGDIPASIMSEVIDSSLLLLGYSAKDWDFRLLYRWIPAEHRRRAFIVMKEDPSSFWIVYLERLGFHIFNMDIYDFAEELQNAWNVSQERHNP